MAKKIKHQPDLFTKDAPQEGVVIGIDLGTTNSAVAVFTADGKAEIINNLDGQRTTPSVVNLHDETNPVVGQAALNMLAMVAVYVIRWIKRLMGKTDSNNNPLAGFIHPDSGRVYEPAEVSACILKYLKDSVETTTGRKVVGAVITVPAHFNDIERRATRKAGELAGLRVLRIVDEPTAAALAYGINKDKAGTLLVYDWGGGTIDVTVLRIEGDKFTVLATAGAVDVGGSDLDLRITAKAIGRYKAQTGLDISPETSLADYLDVLGKAEQIKKELRQATSSSFIVYSQGQRVVFTLTRDELNELAADLVDKTMHLADQAVKDAGLSWAQIDHILMTGGSSRLLVVKDRLAALSGKTPRMDIDPDTAIAMGAAIVAAASVNTLPEPEQAKVVDLDGRKVLPPPVRFQDVTAHGLGCLAKHNGHELRNAVIIPRNTPIPAEHKDVFSLEHEHQTQARITVVQGDDGDRPEQCAIIGEVELSGMPPAPTRGRIEVIYSYNAEGLLSVTATDLVSGLSTNGAIKHPSAVGSVAS